MKYTKRIQLMLVSCMRSGGIRVELRRVSGEVSPALTTRTNQAWTAQKRYLLQERNHMSPLERNPTSESQRKTQNTHCDTGTAAKKDKVQKRAGLQWATGL